jgi:hypothetical protein
MFVHFQIVGCKFGEVEDKDTLTAHISIPNEKGDLYYISLK